MAKKNVQFETKIMSNVPNAEVPGKVAEVMQDPKYVAHNILPEGASTSTIVVIYRK